MKRIQTSLSGLVMVAFLVMLLVSANQLAFKTTNCSGLSCEGLRDCGSNCFCNYAVGICQDAMQP